MTGRTQARLFDVGTYHVAYVRPRLTRHDRMRAQYWLARIKTERAEGNES